MMIVTTLVARTLLLGFAIVMMTAGMIGAGEQAVAQAAPTHTVQPGESLSEIAKQYGVSMEDLMALNDIDDPDTIVIGQVLRLPETNTTPASEPPTPDSEAPAVEVDTEYIFEAPPDMHIVQPGETLSQIAKAYGLAADELMRLNGIEDADTIVIGQKLRLTPPLATGIAQESQGSEAAIVEPAPSITPSNPIASLNPTYQVSSGDNIRTIALRFGVDEEALRQINGLDPAATFLALGQQLILPATRAELVVERPEETTPVETYTVQPGDSLSMIAQEHGLTLAALLSANGIASPDAIYLDQQLVIPPPVVETEQEENALPPMLQIGRPASGFFFYTVNTGDTLSELAREFDSTILALLEYNDLPNPETVYKGLDLRIPYGPPPLPARLPPAPLSGTRFLVSLSRQQCWLFQGDRVAYAWTCSTGYGQWITRTGVFYVQTKLELAKSSAYELDMPYWLGIYDVGSFENGIHGLPVRWETGEKIWTGLVGQPATFGCAMLSDEDAATLFGLAYVGMPVYIVQ
jgi:LysM repeat protein